MPVRVHRLEASKPYENGSHQIQGRSPIHELPKHDICEVDRGPIVCRERIRLKFLQIDRRHRPAIVIKDLAFHLLDEIEYVMEFQSKHDDPDSLTNYNL